METKPNRVRPRSRWQLLGAATVATLIAGCGSPGSSASADDVSAPALGQTYEEIVELAQEEGEVNLWIDRFGDAADIAALNEAFNAATGIEIQFNDVPIGSGDATTRLIAQQQAGQAPSGDVVAGSTDTLLTLDDAGLLRTIEWVELFGEEFPGIDERVERAALDGKAIEVAHQAYVFAYNTDLMGPDDLPERLEDLGDPRYRGMLGVDPRGYPFSFLAPFWGEEEVLALAQQIADNDPVFIGSSPQVAQAIASGEVAFGVVGSSRAEFLKQEGQPVDWISPVEIPLSIESLVVLTGNRHPNAAALFCAWVSSPEGRALLEESVHIGLVWPESGSTLAAQMAEFGTTEFPAATTREELQRQADILSELAAVYEGAD